MTKNLFKYNAKNPASFLQHHELLFLLSKIKQINALNEELRQVLDSSMREMCQVANMQRKQITLLVANASIATTIRFNKNELLMKFKGHALLKHFTDIHCVVKIPDMHEMKERQAAKVTHSNNSSTQTYKHMPARLRPHIESRELLLSSESAQIMRDIANSMDDPKLQAVLLRIANHQKK